MARQERRQGETDLKGATAKVDSTDKTDKTAKMDSTDEADLMKQTAKTHSTDQTAKTDSMNEMDSMDLTDQTAKMDSTPNILERKIIALTERRGFKIALFSIAATTILGNAIIAPALPSMNEYFARTLTNHASFTYTHLSILIRLVLTVPAIFVMLLAPIAGYLMDRFGRLVFLYPALALWTLAGMAGYVLDNLYAIIFSRALLGVAMAFLMTGASALLADYYTDRSSLLLPKGSRREAALSWQSFFCAAGGGLFILSAGLLGEISWHAPFLVYALGALILLLAIFYLFEPRHTGRVARAKGIERESHSTTAGGEGIERKSHSTTAGAKSVERKIDSTPAKRGASVPYGRFSSIYFAGFFCMLIFYIVPTQIPYFMENELGYSPKYIGFSIALLAILEGVFSIFYKGLLARFRIRGMYAFSFFLMGAGFGILWACRGLFMIDLGLVLIGIALAYLLINNAEYLFKLCPVSMRAQGFGVLTSCMYFSQFVSPLLTQPVVERVGFGGLFLLCFALLWLASLLYLLLFRERASGLKPSPYG